MYELDAVGFADMALALHDVSDLEQMLERVIAYARRSTECDDAGIVLLHGHGRMETAVATSSRVSQADNLQKQFREGPSYQAIWNRDSFIVEDTSNDERWPEWGPAAAELGLGSLVCVRLFTLHTTLGALNLYGNKPYAFDKNDLDAAEIFARHASVAVAKAREEDGLRQAIRSRHIIGQAQGILMERHGLNADQAFSVLRRYSRDNNIKLRMIAQEVVNRGRLPAS